MANSIKMDTPRQDYIDNRPNTSRRSADPSPEAKEQFEKVMGEKNDDETDGEENNDGEHRHNSQEMPSAANLLHSLFESKMSAVTAPLPTVGNLGELVDNLVQRILVSNPKAGTPTEIRLQLNDSILPDTEITLSRGPDGLLGVLLVTSNASSMQTLVSAQQSLREQLEKHGPVDVKLSSTDESRQGDNDANRRSRGLVDYGPETL